MGGEIVKWDPDLIPPTNSNAQLNKTSGRLDLVLIKLGVAILSKRCQHIYSA